MPYTDAQARLIMARSHGAKMTGRGKGMSQAAAQKMMKEVPKKQRSKAMKSRPKHPPATKTMMQTGGY